MASQAQLLEYVVSKVAGAQATFKVGTTAHPTDGPSGAGSGLS